MGGKPRPRATRFARLRSPSERYHDTARRHLRQVQPVSCSERTVVGSIRPRWTEHRSGARRRGNVRCAGAGSGSRPYLTVAGIDANGPRLPFILFWATPQCSFPGPAIRYARDADVLTGAEGQIEHRRMLGQKQRLLPKLALAIRVRLEIAGSNRDLVPISLASTASCEVTRS